MINLLFLSNNQDLKEQIKKYAPEFVFVSNDPDIVVIDGDEKALKEHKDCAIIFLTDTNQDFDNVITVQKPFLLKTIFEKLYSAQKIFENNPNYSLKWSNFELFINKKNLVYTLNNTSYKLTEKEVDVLKYFYKNKQKFISKKELLEDVWGYNSEMSTHTIETHIYRLRQKVEPTSEVIIETKDSEYKLK